MRHHLDAAAEHVRLGTVLPEDARLLPLKRLLLRASRMHTEPQMTFNSEMVAFGAALLQAVEELGAGGSHNALVDRAAALQREIEHVERLVEGVEQRLVDLEQTVKRQASALQASLARHEQTQHGRDPAPASAAPAPAPAPLPQTMLRHRAAADSFYTAFEDAFRGDPDDIKERLGVYASEVAAVASSTGAGVVDIGCGRGEWLELLRDMGVGARGVDTNTVTVERCRERGLDVVLDDGLEHLAGLEAESVGVVTAFHVLEHLPFDVIVAFVDEVHRVLKPGGLLVLETPNPDNVLVGASRFHLDPSHRTPLPSPTLAFLAEARGFSDVRVILLHPRDEPAGAGDGPGTRRLLEHFAIGQDYGLLATKPAP